MLWLWVGPFTCKIKLNNANTWKNVPKLEENDSKLLNSEEKLSKLTPLKRARAHISLEASKQLSK